MKTAEQIAEELWEKHTPGGDGGYIVKEEFLAAMRDFKEEYGAAVRQRAAGVCAESQRGDSRKQARRDTAMSCAAAIERMELP